MEHEILTNIWDHIADLRATLIRIILIVAVGFVVVLGFYQPIFQVLTAHWQMEEGGNLLILGPLEGISMVFKVCFWVSLALTSPLWGWVLIQFVIPGLKMEEKRLVIPFLIFSVLSVVLGVAVAYYVTIPLSNGYLSAFNASIGLNAWSLSHYIDYTLVLYMGHAVAFELGLILFMLVHLEWISSRSLIAKRRYMIVAAFILGALLTPPDVATQLLVAIPLIILYEGAILYGKMRKKDTS